MNFIHFEISSLVLEPMKFVSQGPELDENIVSNIKIYRNREYIDVTKIVLIINLHFYKVFMKNTCRFDMFFFFSDEYLQNTF